MASKSESNPDASPTSRDLYNKCAKVKKYKLAGSISLEALLDMLIEKGIDHEIQRDLEGRIIHLFMIPKSVKDLMKESTNSVHLFDCTYKVNK